MSPLSPIEARVLGSLVEKQIATPDYYPLTLNALVNACNQKNHRDPVVSYDEPAVLRALESLRLKNLAYVFAGAAERVRKYGHTFPKTLHLDPAETALLCVLLLRGPQTPGELRSRTPHLYNFATLDQVEETLSRLSNQQPTTIAETSNEEVSPSEALAKEGRTEFSSEKTSPSEIFPEKISPSEALAKEGRPPLIRKLPKLPGTKEARYTHLLSGEPIVEELVPTSDTAVSPNSAAATATPDNAAPNAGADSLRFAHLETEVSQLKSQLANLQSQFATFQKQFE